MKKLMALSFWQPYAWLIVNGHADVDSRTWAPPEKRIGDRIAIHASKRKVSRSEFADFVASMKTLQIKNYPTSREDFDYGALVGTVVISEVVKNSKSYWATPGYFHWNLKSPAKIKPKNMLGKMGWFSVEI